MGDIMSEIKEEKQKLDEQLNDGLTLDKPYVRKFSVSNLVLRVLSYLMGWNVSTGKPMKLRCNSSGHLLTAPAGSGYEYNDTKTGNAPDAYGAMLTFDDTVGTIDVFTWDNACYVKRSIDGSTYQDEIEIPANSVYSFDASTVGINIKNKTGGQVCRYSIVGWY